MTVSQIRHCHIHGGAVGWGGGQGGNNVQVEVAHGMNALTTHPQSWFDWHRSSFVHGRCYAHGRCHVTGRVLSTEGATLLEGCWVTRSSFETAARETGYIDTFIFISCYIILYLYIIWWYDVIYHMFTCLTRKYYCFTTPIWKNVSNIAGTQVLDRSWQSLVTLLPTHVHQVQRERSQQDVPHVPQYTRGLGVDKVFIFSLPHQRIWLRNFKNCCDEELRW